MRKKINQLIEKAAAIETEEGNRLKLIRDCAFSSPSQAASIILSGSFNGLDYWRDENNKTIKELEKEYQNINETVNTDTLNMLTETKEQLFNKYKNGLEKISSEEKRQLVNMRVGQNILRDYLLDSRLSCPLTNITNPHLLRVSHIKP